jgi:hypothetical protein
VWTTPVPLTITPKGPWDLNLRAEAKGPWLAVSRLQIRRGESVLSLIGRGLQKINLFEGKLNWGNSPPELMATLQIEGSIQHFQVPTEMGTVADSVWEGRVEKGACSPLRVSEDDKLLRFYHRKISEIFKIPGTVRHDAEGVHFSSTDGQNTHQYRLSLSEDRRCNAYRWLYPGDHLSIQAAPSQLNGLVRGAERIVIAGLLPPGSPPNGSIHLEVLDDNRSLLQKEIPYALLDGAPREWMLPERVLSRTRLRVLLSSEHTAPYILLTSALLAESPL